MQKISGLIDTLGVMLECRRVARGMSIDISGIVTVREYSSEKITLVTHKGTISIVGTGLCASSFLNQSVEIFGRVSGIEFGYGKN